MNAIAAMRWSHSAGIYCPRSEPKTTPSNVTDINASEAPKKTDIAALDFEVIVITASCVLSPSSAKNNVANAVQKIFHSIVTKVYDGDFGLANGGQMQQ